MSSFLPLLHSLPFRKTLCQLLVFHHPTQVFELGGRAVPCQLQGGRGGPGGQLQAGKSFAGKAKLAGSTDTASSRTSGSSTEHRNVTQRKGGSISKLHHCSEILARGVSRSKLRCKSSHSAALRGHRQKSSSLRKQHGSRRRWVRPMFHSDLCKRDQLWGILGPWRAKVEAKVRFMARGCCFGRKLTWKHIWPAQEHQLTVDVIPPF